MAKEFFRGIRKKLDENRRRSAGIRRELEIIELKARLDIAKRLDKAFDAALTAQRLLHMRAETPGETLHRKQLAGRREALEAKIRRLENPKTS